jgi:hypothetical protein
MWKAGTNARDYSHGDKARGSRIGGGDERQRGFAALRVRSFLRAGSEACYTKGAGLMSFEELCGFLSTMLE